MGRIKQPIKKETKDTEQTKRKSKKCEKKIKKAKSAKKMVKAKEELNMRQEGILQNWFLDKQAVRDMQTATLINNAKAEYDKIGGNLENEELSIENCLHALLNVECMLMNEEGRLYLLINLCKNKKIRDASVAAARKLNSFKRDAMMRKDIYDKINEFSSKKEMKEKFSLEQTRFVENFLISGKRNGLHLQDTTREEIRKIGTEISNLETSFRSNLKNDTTFLYFSESELKGVPKDIIKSFERNKENKCKVTMKDPHFRPVTRLCRNFETRRRIETAYQARCMKKNTKILEKLVELRQKRAELLGYKNHAAYIQEICMAKNPENVKLFYQKLIPKLQPIWEKEKEELLKLKEVECAEDGRDFNGQLDFWDIRYYLNKIEETRYAFDKEKLKEYFPLQKVTTGLFSICQKLLSLKFTKCDSKEIDIWHKEVELFKVEDAVSKDILGYFYLDLHPRDGKSGHAATLSAQSSCIGPDGKQQVSLCAVLANFSKPTETKPALLDHDEVAKFFHEFGHVMHNICSQTKTHRLPWSRMEGDFIEAPSQMLANWVWEKEPLRKISGHYLNGKPIPNQLLDRLIASRIAYSVGKNLEQIIFGTFDQQIHTTGKANTAQIFADTYKEILGVDVIDNTNRAANFIHMGQYDARYYGYLWSQVFSFDMYVTRFKKEGLLNPTVGIDYRNLILKPGGSKDAVDLLKDFLGREPNNSAFLRYKGLK